MVDAGLLDDLMGRVGDGGLQLTGEDGFLPEMIEAVLERGLAAELSDHLGYDKGDPAGCGSPNSRNGTTPKTVATEVGNVRLDGPRDRNGSFEPRLAPKAAGQVVTSWKAALGALAVAYPDRLTYHINQLTEAELTEKDLTSSA